MTLPRILLIASLFLIPIAFAIVGSLPPRKTVVAVACEEKFGAAGPSRVHECILEDSKTRTD